MKPTQNLTITYRGRNVQRYYIESRIRDRKTYNSEDIIKKLNTYWFVWFHTVSFNEIMIPSEKLPQSKGIDCINVYQYPNGRDLQKVKDRKHTILCHFYPSFWFVFVLSFMGTSLSEFLNLRNMTNIFSLTHGKRERGGASVA